MTPEFCFKESHVPQSRRYFLPEFLCSMFLESCVSRILSFLRILFPQGTMFSQFYPSGTQMFPGYPYVQVPGTQCFVGFPGSCVPGILCYWECYFRKGHISSRSCIPRVLFAFLSVSWFPYAVSAILPGSPVFRFLRSWGPMFLVAVSFKDHLNCELELYFPRIPMTVFHIHTVLL